MLPIAMVRQANGYDVNAASAESALACGDESLAVQSQRDEADINVMIRRFGITGTIPVREAPEAIVGHVEEFDLMNAQAVLIAARDSFMSLDADMRARFGNDPMRFVQFCEQKDNLPELRKLGLAKPEVPPIPEVVQKVRIVENDDADTGRAQGSGRSKTSGARGARQADTRED